MVIGISIQVHQNEAKSGIIFEKNGKTLLFFPRFCEKGNALPLYFDFLSRGPLIPFELAPDSEQLMEGS